MITYNRPGLPNHPMGTDAPAPTLAEILDRAIRSQEEASQSRRDALNARFDRIIQELEAIDELWWSHYEDSPKIMTLYMRMRKGVTEHEERCLWAEIIVLKRDIVSRYIVPAIYAAVRAGFVQAIVDAENNRDH